jgi:hypothetical protein
MYNCKWVVKGQFSYIYYEEKRKRWSTSSRWSGKNGRPSRLISFYTANKTSSKNQNGDVPVLSSNTARSELSFRRKMFCSIMIRHPLFLSVGKLVESTTERERERERIKTQWKEMMGTGESFHPSESLREQPWLYTKGRRKLSKRRFFWSRIVRKIAQYLRWTVKGKARKYCSKMARTPIQLTQFSCVLWEYPQQHSVLQPVVCINLPRC